MSSLDPTTGLVVISSMLYRDHTILKIANSVGWEDFELPGKNKSTLTIPPKVQMQCGVVAHRVSWSDKKSDQGKRLYLWEQLKLESECQ